MFFHPTGMSSVVRSSDIVPGNYRRGEASAATSRFIPFESVPFPKPQNSGKPQLPRTDLIYYRPCRGNKQLRICKLSHFTKYLPTVGGEREQGTGNRNSRCRALFYRNLKKRNALQKPSPSGEGGLAAGQDGRGRSPGTIVAGLWHEL